MKSHWRLLDLGPGRADFNMALDEALLITAGKGEYPPTLRFFTWERASLSIGSFQKTERFDLELIKKRGVPLVRRPTGGRAVLHDAELTYSLVCPVPSPFFPSDLMGSYKKIGSCFLTGLNKIGVEAELVPVCKGQKNTPGHNPLCFSSPSWHEVLLDGKKLIGSAQRRLKGSFLQQGSLLIKLDIEGLLSLMRHKDENAKEKALEALANKMTALHEHKQGVSLEKLKSGLVKGFEEELGVPLVPGELLPEEAELAEKLLAKKYSREGWNFKRA